MKKNKDAESCWIADVLLKRTLNPSYDTLSHEMNKIVFMSTKDEKDWNDLSEAERDAILMEYSQNESN